MGSKLFSIANSLSIGFSAESPEFVFPSVSHVMQDLALEMKPQ